MGDNTIKQFSESLFNRLKNNISKYPEVKLYTLNKYDNSFYEYTTTALFYLDVFINSYLVENPTENYSKEDKSLSVSFVKENLNVCILVGKHTFSLTEDHIAKMQSHLESNKVDYLYEMRMLPEDFGKYNKYVFQ
jgi:hypothetical protein